MEREPGYYWVKLKSQTKEGYEWTIGEYRDGSISDEPYYEWALIGSDEIWYEKYFLEIGEKINK